MTIDMGGGQSFQIDYTRVDSIVFSDLTATVLSADMTLPGFSGTGIWIDGAEAFKVDLTGGGTIDLAYDKGSDTLSVTNTTGTGSGTALVIEDLNGKDLRIDQIAVDTNLGSLTSDANIGAIDITGGDFTISTITVDGGAGKIGSLTTAAKIITPTTINADVTSVTLGDVDATIDFNGDVGAIDVGQVKFDMHVTGSLDSWTTTGDLSATLQVDGDLGGLNSTAGLTATGSIVVGGSLGVSSFGDIDGAFTIAGDLTSLSFGAMSAGPDLVIGGDVGSITMTGTLSRNITIGGDLDSANFVSIDVAATVTANQVVGTLVFDVGGTDHGGTYESTTRFVFDGSTGSATTTIIGPTAADDTVAIDENTANTTTVTTVSATGATEGQYAEMYWADKVDNAIYKANADGTGGTTTVISGLNAPVGVEVDYNGGKLYWTTNVAGDASVIQSANLDGTGLTTLVTGLTDPDSIALDLTNGKMYWTDDNSGEIRRANLDGSAVEIVLSGLTNPESVALDVDSGKMYWTDHGDLKIQRANLDGTGVEDLVTTGLSNVGDVELDLDNGKMYWIDGGIGKIQRANLDGTGVEDLVTSGLGDAYYLALDVSAGKMYWTDDGDNIIQRANLDGTGIEDLVTTGVDDPRDVALSAPATLSGPLSYSITAGNTGNAFAIDANTGEITVADSNVLDFETTPVFSLTVEVQDTLSLLTDTATITVNLNDVNDAPVVATTGTTLAYTENDAATPVDSGLSLSDAENDTLTGATVTISANYENGDDVLAFTDQLGISGSWDAPSGTLTLTGNASVADYQTALQSVTFVNSSEMPSTLTRTVSFQVDDGTDPSNVATRDISVDSVNDAPVANADSSHLVFDGDDFIQVADHASLQMTNNLTMEAWINHSGNGTGSQIILNKEGEYELGITSDTGEIKFAIANAPTWNWHNTGFFVTANEWTHIAVTYDAVAGEAKTFINGNLVDTYSQSGAVGDVYPGFGDLFIGGRENATTQRFQGSIDDVRIWGSTRSEVEIQNNYSDNLSGAEPGLAGNWRLDEADGTLVADQSPNGNDGTLGGVEGAASTPTYDGYLTDEDTLLVIPAVDGVLANDFDADGDTLTVTNLDTTGMLGTLVLNPADGSFSYDPRGAFDSLAVGEIAYETFTYTANDGTVDSNAVTVTLTVVGANDAPVSSNDSYVVNEDTTLDVDWFDTDWTARQTLTLDNSGQTENLVDFPVLVVLDPTPVTGNIDYAKTQDNGEDLRFFASDGTALDYDIEAWDESGKSYVWVKVPLITAGPGTNSITMYYGNATAVTGENAEAVWSNGFESVQLLNDNLQDASANSNNGTNFGSTSSTGQVADGQQFDGIDDDINLGSDASVDDIFAGGATVSAWINPSSWGENNYGRIFDKSGATLPGAGWALEVASGTQSLLFQQGFSGGVTSWQSANGSIGLNSWQHVAVTYDSSDPANEPTFYINGVEVGKTIDGTTPTGTALSDAGLDLHIGNHAMDTVRTFDGSIDDVRLSSEVRSADWIRAQHLGSNNALVTFGGEETAPAIGGVLGNDVDVDNESLSVILDTGPANASSFTLNKDGTFSYTPNSNFTGTDSFTYKVNDGTTDSNIVTVNITVNPVNDAPTGTTLVVAAVEETATAIDISSNVTDVDGTVDLTTTLVTSGPSNGSLTNNGDGTFSYTGDLNFVGADSFTYTVEDNDGQVSSDITVTINVSDVNDAPTGTTLVVAALEETATAIDISSNVTDVDGTVDLTTTLVTSGPSNGSLTNNGDGTFSYTGDLNFVGADSFTYTVEDNDGQVSSDITVTINVSDVNDAPTGTTLVVAALEETATAIDISSNVTDVDGTVDLTTTLVTSGPSNGSLTNNGDGTFSYTGDLNFVGADSFTYTVEDNDGQVSSDITVTINVSDVNDAPTGTTLVVAAVEETATAIDISGNVADVDGTVVLDVPRRSPAARVTVA